ncbi:MAG: TRAP transporter small permease [Alphaproteobacteria bacterium]|nr:TRAP transporter small permease [Alphaproteobacteria bacterium]MCB9930479.1 TRAP transporter small permease [Alphaproteobacteria bacterium]
MRIALDRLYRWSGYLAAVFLALIALTIIAQICGRFFGVAIDSTETAGFALAATTFFGLAHTYRQGAHIRVTLFTRLARGGLRRGLNLWAVGLFAAMVGYFCYWSFDLVYFSWKFGDISPGLLAIPFWIPRSAMALGALCLLIALVDEFVALVRGLPATYDPAELAEAEGHLEAGAHVEDAL